MALKNIERPDSEWSYCLERLFDPEELYYTSMDELLKRYKKRNLVPGRMYNLAKKYGNVLEKRTRIINAPQMERAGQRIFGTENFYHPPPKVYFCSQPKKYLKERQISVSSESENEEDLNYEIWMQKRKNLRNGLDKLDLNSEYLNNKKNLTEIEKRVLRSMLFADKQMQTDSNQFDKKDKSSKKKVGKPKENFQTPIAMKKIEDFLEANRWRLIDLFKDLDKNKDWSINRNDFLRECKKGKLEIPDEMIEELVKVLNRAKTEKIFYKELAKGRTSHLSDRRSELKNASLNSLNSVRSTSDRNEPIKSRSSIHTNDTSKTDSKDGSYQVDSRLSNNLTLPKIDSSFEFNSVEKKKTERSVSVASSRSLVKRSNSETSVNNELNDTKNFLDELRHKNIKEYIKCLEKTKSLNIKSSSLLNALVVPTGQSSQELIRILKSKTDKKKFLIKQGEKEMKLRNRRRKLINQMRT